MTLLLGDKNTAGLITPLILNNFQAVRSDMRLIFIRIMDNLETTGGNSSSRDKTQTQ